VSFGRSPARATSTPAASPSQPHTWRPMAFSDREPKHIKDPLCEPLWAGRRSLVHVDRYGVTIRDEEAAELEGFEVLREAILGASQAVELVLDGYLMPGPLRSNPVADVAPGSESMVTPGQLTRQMFLGGGGRNARREAIERAEARRVELAPEGPTAFVAVDLLWLDGESLLQVPLLERRRLLESALLEVDLVRRSVAVRPPVEAWYAQWKTFGIQEFAVKEANSRYVPGGTSRDWVTAPIPRR
jgi:ATP-dependent DNA ligase